MAGFDAQLFLVHYISVVVERNQVGLTVALAGDHHAGAVFQHRDVGDQRIADHQRRGPGRNLDDFRLIDGYAQDIAAAGRFGGVGDASEADEDRGNERAK